MESWVQAIITNLATAGGAGLIGFFSGRRKSNAEVKGLDLDNVGKAVALWRELAEANKADNILLKKEIAELSKQIDKQSKELASQSEKIKDLQQDLITVHRENKQLKDYLIKQGIDYTIINNNEGN